MEAIALGAAIGAGAMVLLRHGRAGTKKLLGWTAHQAGWVTERVNAAVDGAKRVARDEYQRGRETNLERIAEMPPLSARNGAQSATQQAPAGHVTPPTTSTLS